MTEPAAVALHAIRIADVKPADTVIIIGCGTIGLIAAQIDRAFGAARVIPLDISEDRLELARDLGFTDAANSKDNLSEKLTALADVVLEMVGSSATYNLAIDLAKARGRVVFTGNIADDLLIPQKRVSSILRKELTILGTWNSTALGEDSTDWKELLTLVDDERIILKPLISHQISLAELPSMIDRMAQREQTFGKVIVNFEQ